ncbi:MAG: NADH-quinone oxidoreductase subunit K [Ilumatobacter sp.]|jgi:multicomponent Na+:H+ antiporter subunit C|uniref:NADH-quinone oxidoreductase subunit K n=1 Tax=Ilumatobacter sp. TaxID=1967498 RepID=UPI003919A726
MSWEQAILIGVLAGVGTYLVMHRTLTRIILGLGLLGNAINLLILSSGDGPGVTPIIGQVGDFTDPVPQALVLTAIVIGFGVTSFLLAMAYRMWTIDGSDEVEDDISDRLLAESDSAAAAAADDNGTAHTEAGAASEATPNHHPGGPA